MAKKKPSTALAVKHALARFHTPRPMVKPIVIKTTSVVKHKPKRRRSGGGGLLGGGSRGLMNKERMGIVAGAFVVGLLEKQGIIQSLPKLPLIGTTGTIGLGAYLLSDGGKNRLADEVCTAALVLAAHSLSATGSIIGEGGYDGDVGYVAGW